LGCRKGEELKYEDEDEEGGLNMPVEVLGGEGRLNRL